MPSFPAFHHYALTVSNLQRSIDWYERLFGSPPAEVIDEDDYRAAMWFEPRSLSTKITISLRATCSMNFESDSTTSPLVARVEKSSNPGQHDSMPWISSMVRSWIVPTGPVSHFGTRTTFSSSSFCRWVHRLPGTPNSPDWRRFRLRARDSVLTPQHKADHGNGQDRHDGDQVIPSAATWRRDPTRIGNADRSVNRLQQNQHQPSSCHCPQEGGWVGSPGAPERPSWAFDWVSALGHRDASKWTEGRESCNGDSTGPIQRPRGGVAACRFE